MTRIDEYQELVARIRLAINEGQCGAEGSVSDSESSSDSDEESCESYCSSDMPSLRADSPREGGHNTSSSDDEPEPARYDDTFNARMRRIEQWRDTYAKALGAEFGE